MLFFSDYKVLLCYFFIKKKVTKKSRRVKKSAAISPYSFLQGPFVSIILFNNQLNRTLKLTPLQVRLLLNNTVGLTTIVYADY